MQMQDLIKQLLAEMGEDPSREGLLIFSPRVATRKIVRYVGQL